MKHFYIKNSTNSALQYIANSTDVLFLSIFKSSIIVILILVTFSVDAQKATLLFSKSMLSKTPRMIELELSDSLGIINPSAVFFNQSDMIYFVVKPQQGQDWTLSRKDAEKKLIETKLIHQLIEIPSIQSKPLFLNDDIKGVVLSFPKNKINILKEIKIKLDETESESIFIPEKLWPGYKTYNEIIASATSYALNEDYINAFKNISRLWCKDSLLSKFSFYVPAKDSLCFWADQISLQTNTLFNKQMEAFNLNSSEQNLKQLYGLKDSIYETLILVDTFLISIKNEIDAVSRSIKIDKQKQFITQQLDLSKLIFRKKKLLLFEEKNYQDYQLKLFTETLSKIITSITKIRQISGFDSININQIKKYPSLFKEISEMGWTNDFQSVCKLLNENIIRNQYIFNDTVINNFSQNKINEPQPYHALFSAFNALVKKDKRLFVELINQCMYAVSDKELLSSLDLYIALVNSETTNNDEYWELIQKGYNLQINGSLQEAKLNYEKAEKLFNMGEILFFLIAETNLKLGDRYGAEIYFKRANVINPKFILPKLYQIEFLIEDKDYETAITLVNEALTNNPIWYFYFKKAVLLGLTGKYNDSKTLLLNNCLPLNQQNYEQYLFLGDICNALTDAKSAREYYMKAGNIKPNDNAYKNKMESLKQNNEIKPIK